MVFAAENECHAGQQLSNDPTVRKINIFFLDSGFTRFRFPDRKRVVNINIICIMNGNGDIRHAQGSDECRKILLEFGNNRCGIGLNPDSAVPEQQMDIIRDGKTLPYFIDQMHSC